MPHSTASSDRPAPARTRQGRVASVWRDNLESFLWAVLLAFVIRTFIVAPFKIPSGSMRPTLIEGDRILVNKFVYRLHPPRRGDIIVFYFPSEWRPFRERLTDPTRNVWDRLFNFGRPFIKRLIAIGGDEVEIRDGKVFVNGHALDGRPMFRSNQYYNQGPYGEAGRTYRVPEKSFYVLGDNSLSSHDSRFWGFVPEHLVIGEAICIFWPLPRWRILR